MSPNIHEQGKLGTVKPLNFMHTIFFTKTMMFLDKFKHFLYELSFIQLRQDQRIDIWYYVIEIP